jgi:hypothetical protein
LMTKSPSIVFILSIMITLFSSYEIQIQYLGVVTLAT